MKIYIWGTGRLVGKVVGKYIPLENVAGFIDNDSTKTEYMGKTVMLPEKVLGQEYDAILVANLFGKEILKQCKRIGIDVERVILLYGNCELKDSNRNYEFVEKVLGKEYGQIVKDRYHVVRGVEAYGDLFLGDFYKGGYLQSDYVRIKTLELAVKEIRKRKFLGGGGCSRSRSIPRGICSIYQLCFSGQKMLFV